MVKNQTPAKSFGKSPQNKGPQSMKKGGSPNKPSPGGRPGQAQQFRQGGGFTPKSQQKNFPSPKQVNFQGQKQTPKGPQQTPKGQQQTPKGQQKQQQSGKKTTPHPVKGKPQMESDDEDDDDEFDSEEFDEMDDEEMEDESGESLEDEESDDEKPANGSAKKQLVQKPAQGKKGQPAQPPKKAANGKPAAEEESDDDFDSEEDEDEEDEDEMESEEDEEDSDDDMVESPKKNLSFLKPDKKQATPAQKPGAAAQKAGATPVQKPGATPAQKPGQAEVQKGKAQASQQQQSKPLKRPAPDDDEDEEDEDDEDEEDEDEEEEDDDDEEDEEDEEESEDDEEEVKGAKKGQQQQAQKKMKTNEGNAVVTASKGMPTKMDKKLLTETEERTRERDRRSLFLKDLPRNVTDEEIKALSPDIVSVVRRSKTMRWGWIVFASEQVCQKNYEKLKNAKMGNSQIFVDFCGEKSKSGTTKKELDPEQRVDALKLYVGNLPPKATESDLKLLFPTASDFFFRPERQFAFVTFATPEKARTAFENSKDAKVKGALVQVSYARLKVPKDQQKKKNDNVKKFAAKQASGKVITRG